jgi:hypothetical protein
MASKSANRPTPNVWKVLIPIVLALAGLSGVIIWGFASGAFFGSSRAVADKSKTKDSGSVVERVDEKADNATPRQTGSKTNKKTSSKQTSDKDLTSTPEKSNPKDETAKVAADSPSSNASPTTTDPMPESTGVASADKSSKQPDKENPAPNTDNAFANQLLASAPSSENDSGQKSPPPRDSNMPQEGNAKSTDESKSGSNDPFDVPGVTKKSGETDSPKKEAAKSDSPTKSSTESSAPTVTSMAATGMSDIPAQFELPPVDGSGTPDSLAPLNLPEGSEMIVDLIYDPEKCGKGKNYFTVDPSKNKPEWKILHSTKADDPDAKAIARFFLDEQQLKFAWEKSVEPKSNANFLINSALNLTTEKENKIIALRKPATLDSLSLNEKTFTFKDSLDIPWLPTDGVKVEFGTLNPAQFGEGRIDNPQMANKSPATISFTELVTERVFWIAVSADFRNKADLRIEVQTKNERGPIVLSPKTLNEVMDGLQAINAQLVMENNLAQEILGKTPPGTTGIGKKRDDAKAAEKKMKEAQIFRAKAVEQAEMVRNLVGVPIPLRIVYEFQNQKIELARTSNFSTEPLPDPDEKKKR